MEARKRREEDEMRAREEANMREERKGKKGKR